MNSETIPQQQPGRQDAQAPQQPDGLSIGKQLFQARTRKGLSLSEAAEATKIKVNFLEAIENDSFEVLPAAIYAKNFIRIYGQFLGLDGQALASRFGQQVTIKTELPEKTETTSAYHIAVLITFLLRHKFLTILTLLFIIILYSIFSGTTAEEGRTPVTEKTGTAEQEVREQVAAWPAVTDMDEPLPELE